MVGAGWRSSRTTTSCSASPATRASPRSGRRSVASRAGTSAARAYRWRAAGVRGAASCLRDADDADRRRRYDDQLRRQPAPIEWSHLRRPAAGDLRRPFTPTSLAAEVVLDAKEAIRGTLLTLDVPVSAVCGTAPAATSSTASSAGATGRSPAGCPCPFTCRRSPARARCSRCAPTTPRLRRCSSRCTCGTVRRRPPAGARSAAPARPLPHVA